MESIRLKVLGQMLCLAFGACASVASAVEPRIFQVGDAGAISPHVRLEFGSDNNPLRSDDGSEQALFFRLEPEFRYLVRQRNNELELGYKGDFIQYFEDYCLGNQTVRPGDCVQGAPAFNRASFEDHQLFLNGFLEISSRLRARLELSQTIDHQELGTGLSSNRGVLDSLTEPDSFNTSRARAELSYGAALARGQVRVGINFTDQQFDSVLGSFSNLEETAVAPDARLLYRIGTRTQVFAGLGFADVTGGDSERTINRQLVGVEFDASAITSGTITLSNEIENFSSNRRDLNFFGFDVELTWRPRRFSTVTISGGRQSERGLFNDDIGVATRINARWQHFWRDRFSTLVGLRLAIDDDVDEFSEFEGQDTQGRFRFEANYNIRRWLDIGGFIELDSRSGGELIDGTDQVRDFDRTLIGFTANGTI